MLVRFSQLVVEQPRISELDINPLLASPAGIVALDARVVLHGWTVREAICRGQPFALIRLSMRARFVSRTVRMS